MAARTPEHTLAALEKLIADAPADAPSGAKFIKGLDTRVLEWLIADSRDLRSADRGGGYPWADNGEVA